MVGAGRFERLTPCAQDSVLKIVGLVGSCGIIQLQNHLQEFCESWGNPRKLLILMVGLGRFELPTSCTPSKRASQAAPQPDVVTYVPDCSTLGFHALFKALSQNKMILK
jgi:hypothetical protein